ncbi:MAG: hypothetical protein Q9193_004010 [Seirophora villosa]
MYLLQSAFASLLLLSVNAAPQAPSQLDDKTPRTPDLCGPLVQDGSTPPDTCASDPPVVSKPAPFGILGTLPNLDQADAISQFQPNWWSCNQTVMQTCAKMAANDTRAGAWYFETGPYNNPNEGDPACQIGFWLPRDDVGNADLPPDAQFKSDPTAAQKPTLEQCETTLTATVAKMAENKEGWVGASINLEIFPKDQPGQWRHSEETSGTKRTGKWWDEESVEDST